MKQQLFLVVHFKNFPEVLSKSLIGTCDFSQLERVKVIVPELIQIVTMSVKKRKYMENQKREKYMKLNVKL